MNVVKDVTISRHEKRLSDKVISFFIGEKIGILSSV